MLKSCFCAELFILTVSKFCRSVLSGTRSAAVPLNGTPMERYGTLIYQWFTSVIIWGVPGAFQRSANFGTCA